MYSNNNQINPTRESLPCWACGSLYIKTRKKIMNHNNIAIEERACEITLPALVNYCANEFYKGGDNNVHSLNQIVGRKLQDANLNSDQLIKLNQDAGLDDNVKRHLMEALEAGNGRISRSLLEFNLKKVILERLKKVILNSKRLRTIWGL